MTEIKNLNSLIQKLNSLGEDVNEAVYNGVDTTIKAITRDAKLLAPVDTGTLRNSISDEIEKTTDSITGVSGTNIEYAVYQELGTSKMAAHPYLEPSFQANKLSLIPNIQEEMKKKIKEK